ncbi:MAG: hypothetical protein IT174_10805 [Acidobacteria bacterium]|nr:hypothetical protein [Acidobacteriota bacterium]
MARQKSVEQQREEFLAREARECRKWQQPKPFEPEHNACPWMDAETETEALAAAEEEVFTTEAQRNTEKAELKGETENK